MKCQHPESQAFESWAKSPKNWNGWLKCQNARCNKMWFDEYVKYWLDRKNGVERKTSEDNKLF